METLAQGVGVAALTGVTILAYKHPHAYKKIELPSIIFKFGIAVFLVMLIWHQATSTIYLRLIPFIKVSDQQTVQKIVDSLTISGATYFTICGSFMALWGYLIFLTLLPSLLQNDENDRNK